jgi:hypothetical protein
MATWSQKTYEAVAEALMTSRNGNIHHDHGVDTVMWRLVEVFEDDNERFSRELFLVAAGWEAP